MARSTFRSQNVENTPGPDHFWKLRCRKIACRCGAKYISKSNVENTPGPDHFWKLRCRKIARHCGAKHISKSNVENTPGPDHFWKLRCRKIARHCGPKHISKSKCIKQTRSGPLLEVEMSKNCTPLWREAHFEVKMYKNTTCSLHFCTFGCRFAWQAQGIVDLVNSEQNLKVL